MVLFLNRAYPVLLRTRERLSMQGSGTVPAIMLLHRLSRWKEFEKEPIRDLVNKKS